eukprot:UN07558
MRLAQPLCLKNLKQSETVITFFRKYSNYNHWTHSQTGDVTYYKLVYNNTKAEFRFSLLYPMTIYLGQIVGLQKTIP